MKAPHWILPLVIASTLAHAAEDKPDTSRWKEDFSDEAAFPKNWSSYGWLPDGKVVSGPENMHRWWQIQDGVLRGQTFGKLHPSGLQRKISGKNVRLNLRFNPQSSSVRVSCSSRIVRSHLSFSSAPEFIPVMIISAN